MSSRGGVGGREAELEPPGLSEPVPAQSAICLHVVARGQLAAVSPRPSPAAGHLQPQVPSPRRPFRAPGLSPAQISLPCGLWASVKVKPLPRLPEPRHQVHSDVCLHGGPGAGPTDKSPMRTRGCRSGALATRFSRSQRAREPRGGAWARAEAGLGTERPWGAGPSGGRPLAPTPLDASPLRLYLCTLTQTQPHTPATCAHTPAAPTLRGLSRLHRHASHGRPALRREHSPCSSKDTRAHADTRPRPPGRHAHPAGKGDGCGEGDD